MLASVKPLFDRLTAYQAVGSDETASSRSISRETHRLDHAGILEKSTMGAVTGMQLSPKEQLAIN